MTKSELIDKIFKQYKDINNNAAKQELSIVDINKSINHLINAMIDSLSHNNRIEIRGFGGFSLHYCKERMGRNPKNGENVFISSKYIPHFKPGKELKNRVNKVYKNQK